MPRLPAAKIAPSLFAAWRDRKSTRLNSSHDAISYAVFCLEKKSTRLNCGHDRLRPAPLRPAFSVRPHAHVCSASSAPTSSRCTRVMHFLFFFFLKNRPPPEPSPFPPPPPLRL